MDIIKKYPDKPWSWKDISYNKNITMEFVEKYIDKDWDWNEGISRNPNLTIEMLYKYPDKDWNTVSICQSDFKIDYEIELEKLKNFKMIEEELIQKHGSNRFQDWKKLG